MKIKPEHILPERTFNVLSIDAWRYDGGWTWNAWYKVGKITERDLNALFARNGWQCQPRKLLAWMRKSGYLSAASAGRVSVEDDNTNIVVRYRNNGRPLFAIEYGVDT
jgi:hypothetical protein